MRITKFAAVLAFGAVAGSTLVHADVPLVKVDGSSTVYPITEAVAEDFQKSKKNGVRVTVGISGTGGGFKKFCRGETDISDASKWTVIGDKMPEENFPVNSDGGKPRHGVNLAQRQRAPARAGEQHRGQRGAEDAGRQVDDRQKQD